MEQKSMRAVLPSFSRGGIMSLREALVAELPFLRRYARALTGSQSLGDAAVREMLEALLEAPDELQSDKPVRAELFRIFHRLWNPEAVGTLASKGRSGIIAQFPVDMRQSLLLTAVEGFSEEEVAIILGIDAGQVDELVRSARAAIEDALSAEVLIIEDESIIAMHIKQIVEALGHTVVGIVRTHAEAVVAAKEKRPELVLADISLADGSSGIDAVKDILAEQDVPVIFITAFPERLLTGSRPEPTYLITKPFEPETVVATIGQALLLHREQDDGKTSARAGTFSAA
jgi:DNA-directed RNA polymerase specialized sigma24 family protein/CheY-like chemotaxis protein